jgi:anti-anti-sigma regulatory factor
MTTTQNEGGQTKLAGLSPQIRKLLEMTRLDSVFEIHENVEAALTSF